MAKKKDTTKTSDAPAAAAKAPKKKAAAPKAAAASKTAAAPKAAAKSATPAPAPAVAKKAAAKKKAAPVKLTDNQTDLLKKVHGAGDAGLPADNKATTKLLEVLKGKKLLKKGKKNKESGHVHYHVSKTGEKHIGSSSNSAS